MEQEDQRYLGFVFTSHRVTNDLIISAYLLSCFLRVEARVWFWGFNPKHERTFRMPVRPDYLPLQLSESFRMYCIPQIHLRYTLAFELGDLLPAQLKMIEDQFSEYPALVALHNPSHEEWDLGTPVKLPRVSLVRWMERGGTALTIEQPVIKWSQIASRRVQ